MIPVLIILGAVGYAIVKNPARASFHDALRSNPVRLDSLLGFRLFDPRVARPDVTEGPLYKVDVGGAAAAAVGGIAGTPSAPSGGPTGGIGGITVPTGGGGSHGVPS